MSAPSDSLRVPGGNRVSFSETPEASSATFTQSRRVSTSEAFCDKPTPYPKNSSDADAYFDVASGDEDGDGDAQQFEPEVSDSFAESYPPESEKPRYGRTFSTLEAGNHTRPRAHSGVVASLIRFGLERTQRPAKGHDSHATHGSGDTSRSNSVKSMKRSPSLEGDEFQDDEKRRGSIFQRGRKRAEIITHVEDYIKRQKFIIRLAKALLTFGAPSHRIESQLKSAAKILHVHAGFVHLPNLVIVSFLDSGSRTSELQFVKAGGRVALTALHHVHLVYRDVLHDKISASEGSEKLKQIMQAGPIYSLYIRCFLAFICSSIICVLSFGGALPDMFISGLAAGTMQYLGLHAAAKSAIYANVYEISVSLLVSFLARALGTIPGKIFCFTAISSAGVVLILPGFTILISALELTSRNIMCGSVRMVYAVIYTLFLGFGLTIGSDLYLVVNPHARKQMLSDALTESEKFHGTIIANNVTLSTAFLNGTYTFLDTAAKGHSEWIKGCYRDDEWPWYRRPFPWWTMFFLVPLYSTCSSLANMQSWRSVQLPVMVVFSCLAYTANKATITFVSTRGEIASAFGALVIGLCGNLYSRIIGGTAFTSMVTGVLFLVPSALGSGGGLIQSYESASAQYSGSFQLGIRMIQVAIGVTIGLFVSQILVYAMGRRKNVAHFAF